MDQNQDKARDITPQTRLNEALSALMDDEVDELELRRILRELPANPELTGIWKRYHAVRASLQQDMHLNPRADLLKGVQARLAAEAASADLHQGRLDGMLRSRIARYVGQGVIAASFAAAALMGVSLLEVANTDDAGADTASLVADASPVLSGEFNAPEQTRTVSLDSEAYSRLQQAVYREFSTVPQQIPYNPALPAELAPAQ